MSSRVLRGETIGPVSPVTWRRGSDSRAPHDSSGPRRDRPRSGGQEIEPRERQAYENGFADGRAAAQKEHLVAVEPLLCSLKEITASVTGVTQKIRQDAEQELVELAVEIARRIVHRELTIDPDALRALVKVALDRVALPELTRIRTSPAHLEVVRAAVEAASPHRNVDLVADPKLRPGHLVFETERGDLDASVESQLDEIHRGLTDRLRA
jgi:flagellar assembly protein FliH